MDQRKIVGRVGEDIAAQHLIEKGYKLVEKNVRIGKKEIDLIVRKGEKYVFVEVKTRTSFIFGSAAEALGARQYRTIKKAIEYYCFSKNIDLDNVRLDFIAVDLDDAKGVAQIEHVKEIA